MQLNGIVSVWQIKLIAVKPKQFWLIQLIILGIQNVACYTIFVPPNSAPSTFPIWSIGGKFIIIVIGIRIITNIGSYRGRSISNNKLYFYIFLSNVRTYWNKPIIASITKWRTTYRNINFFLSHRFQTARWGWYRGYPAFIWIFIGGPCECTSSSVFDGEIQSRQPNIKIQYLWVDIKYRLSRIISYLDDNVNRLITSVWGD